MSSFDIINIIKKYRWGIKDEKENIIITWMGF
jgi:hypothetical protein